MAARSIAPLLNLTTLVDKPSVKIDGVKYALSVPDALSLMDCHRLSVVMARIDALSPKLSTGTLAHDEEADLSEAFAGVCRVVLAAPDPVQAKLTAIQRLYIYQAFLQLPQSTLRLVGAMATGATSRPTGAKSSRGSRGSTAASARTSGLNASHPASSARTS
jgi:hypothetical protein